MSVKTNWIALWKQREGLYVTKAITQNQIKELPKKCRIYVRYNKFYHADTNRPKFILCFSDASELTPIELKTEQCEEEMHYIEVNEAIRIAREALSDLQYGNSIDDVTVEVASAMEENSFSNKDESEGNS